MKFTKLAATLLCSVALLCGCTKNTDVVLKVNDAQITRGEFYGDFEKLKDVQLKQLKSSSPEEKNFIALSLKERYTNDTIVRTLLKGEFEKRKIEATEEEIAAKQKDIIQKIGSEEEFKKILKENNITKERLHSDLANEVKIDKLAQQLAPKTISDKDVQAFYNQNKEQFKTPETVHAYHILFNTNPEEIKRAIVDADKEAKLSNAEIEAKVKAEVASQEKLFNEVYAKVQKNPKSFESLAKQYSKDPGTKDKGGDLGYIQRADLVKEFGDVAFSQKVGTISKTKSPFGEHIIYVTDKKQAGVQPLANIKEKLKEYLEQNSKTAALRNLVENLQKSAKIEYVDESIKPESIKKDLEEAQQKFIEAQRKKTIPESKMKTLYEMKEKQKQEEKK